MGFASAWLNERTLFPRFIGSSPDNHTGIIVIIPAYNEPGIITLLDSLNGCNAPFCKTEAIIVVNAPASANDEEISGNEKCIDAVELWKKQNKRTFFDLYVINTGRSVLKEWGVGLARKTGMDEALRRFDDICNPEGLIVSLDADCKVDPEYFTALESDFLLEGTKKACSIAFEHDLPDDPVERKSIIQYELHLRYYLQAHNYCGFPYAYHTVGSSMAVRASQYLKCGGMNRRQAGEDFYFIQKLVELGGYFSLNSTRVYPSARQSYRVPFGTGAMMRKMASGNADILYTYNINAFKELKQFFSLTETLRLSETDELTALYKALPASLVNFIDVGEFINKISEIKENTNGEASFRKRFFVWFNMFRIVRYLNDSHMVVFEKQPVEIAACELLKLKGFSNLPSGSADLLQFYRDIESS